MKPAGKDPILRTIAIGWVRRTLAESDAKSVVEDMQRTTGKSEEFTWLCFFVFDIKYWLNVMFGLSRRLSY